MDGDISRICQEGIKVSGVVAPSECNADVFDVALGQLDAFFDFAVLDAGAHGQDDRRCNHTGDYRNN
ncbi:hypothetical protein PROH_16840 [Prochlorothrix hollandica PCC 9006 = CALU 1027]|uniref:Uncharacterized protein n=1 Tax=Prochlorothrix hollandica PCC 9006 = CALU 1027 TaxID=317619 RepID=A0A0M2PPS0_PROHO|nr:hypothetical protein PROH_16840 [Prochlorothrix hollandica PCC 9006 = CALU 1027]